MTRRTRKLRSVATVVMTVSLAAVLTGCFSVGFAYPPQYSVHLNPADYLGTWPGGVPTTPPAG